MADDPQAMRAQLIAAAMKQKLPLVSLDPTCQWTSDKDQVAVEALNRAPAANYETGGVLYQNKDGQYCYSIPVGNSNSAQVQYGVNVPKDLSLAGLYHMHPQDNGLGKDHSEKFSPDDVDTARKLKLASYIRVLKTGETKKYEPGASALGQVINPIMAAK